MEFKQIAVLAIYAIDVLFCLIAIGRKNSRAYALTKTFLMPLLCSVYFVMLPPSLKGT